MNPAQQQLVAQWNQYLQQLGGQLNQLLQQAGAGCQQMIAQNPTDPMPLNNALGAIDQQVRTIVRQVDDAVSPTYDRLCTVGPGEPAYAELQRGARWWRL